MPRKQTGRSVESKILANIVARCTNPNNTNYRYYGGRGIQVCRRWREGGFKVFVEDMGRRPSPEHEVDRRNNNAHYSCGQCPECVEKGWEANCRWLPHLENSRNRRGNRLLEYQGETLCLAAFAEKFNLTPSAVKARLLSGWTLDEIVEIPLGKPRPKTHCPHGHPYADGNIYTNKKGRVVCRQCVLDRGKHRPSRRRK